MGKSLFIAGAFVLALAACGGSDEPSSDSEETASTTAAQSSGEETDETTPPAETTAPAPEATADDGDDGDDGDSDGAAGTGPSTATVTIDGETYEFSTEGAIVAQCKTDLFGVFIVQLPRVGGDGNVSVVALREGTDPAVVEQTNSVQVSLGDDDWVADEGSDLFDNSEALQPGMSQVDSVEIDGSTVRGSATFVRTLSAFGVGELETVTGTFEATCGEERVS